MSTLPNLIKSFISKEHNMETINNITQNATNMSQKLLQKTCSTQENLKQQLKHLQLATLGAFSVCQEQIQEKVKQLIDKGTQTEKELNAWAQNLWHRGRKETKETIDEVEKSLEISTLLSKMNIPSKNDVEALALKVEELNRKIDEITHNEQQCSTEPVGTVV